MTVESATYINELVPGNTNNASDASEGDDHIALIKTVLQATFPNVTGAVNATQAEMNALDGLTATVAELNILDGVTATAAELNILDGVTATTAELNILDGVTATAAELNTLDGITSTVTELNLLDGITAILDEDNMASNSATALATQQSVKSYVDTTVAGLDFATEAYVDARATVVYSGTEKIISTSGANTILIPIGVAGTVTRFDVVSAAQNLASAVLTTAASAAMASVTPVAATIVSDTSITNAAVTAGTFLRLVITESSLGDTFVSWSIVVDIS